MHGEVTAHFKRKEPEKIPMDPAVVGKFLDSLMRRPGPPPQKSNYARIMGKRQLKKTSIDKVKKQQEELERNFLLSSGLTKEALYDESKAETGKIVRKFKLGEPMVEHLSELTTQMRRFHVWYLEQSKAGRCIFAYKYRHCDFLHGDGEYWIYFDEMYQLYHQDAIGVQIMSLWTL